MAGCLAWQGLSTLDSRAFPSKFRGALTSFKGKVMPYIGTALWHIGEELQLATTVGQSELVLFSGTGPLAGDTGS